jgi:hypothetical protein
MSTDDCKQFIDSIAEQNGFSKKEKWKRVRKYKENNKSYREFQNSNGDTIIIAEDATGKLSLVNIKKSSVLSEQIKKTLNKTKLYVELFKLYGNLFITEKRNNFLEVDDEYFTKAFNKFKEDGDESLLEQYAQNYVPRYNEVDEACNIVRELEEDEWSYERKGKFSTNANFVADTMPKKVGVIYDKENICISYQEKEGISYFRMECGGDWECAVMSFIYWSEKEQRLKGFFPKGDGNVYNTLTNTAYGSENDSDLFDEDKEEEYQEQMEKIDQNYDKYSTKAEEKGFQQLKDYILAIEV